MSIGNIVRKTFAWLTVLLGVAFVSVLSFYAPYRAFIIGIMYGAALGVGLKDDIFDKWGVY